LAANAFSPTGALDQTLAQRVDRDEIGAHSFHHDLPVDVDHVAVADAALVYHRGHLDTRAEFAGQSSRSVD
jgi:hypothetical protein